MTDPNADPVLNSFAPLELADPQADRVWSLPAPDAVSAIWWHISSKRSARADRDFEALSDEEIDKILAEDTLGEMLGDELVEEIVACRPRPPIETLRGLLNAKAAWFVKDRAAALEAWEARYDPPAKANREERREAAKKAKKKSR